MADDQSSSSSIHKVNGKLFAPPAMSWNDVMLRPVRASDQEFVQIEETTGELAARWRFRGATPGPQEWMERTFAGVLAQYLVFVRAANAPVGLVTAYEAHFEHGTAKVAAARFGADAQRSPAMVPAVALLIRHVLTSWNLRKLYMDVPEYNLPQFDSLIGPYFGEEGRLVDHLFYGGAYWDHVILALYRDAWPEIERRILGQA